ncbi:hypothetical protein Tco_0997643 [Tanacetum coccineum]
MANFPRLYELAVVVNSRELFHGMLVYFDRENRKDLDFANGLHNLWDELLERTNERQLFITELEGLCPSVMTYKILKFLNEVQKHDLIQLLEIRKMIVGTYRQVSRKIALIEAIREINEDLQFAVGLSQLWDVLYIRVNELRMLSSELNVFGGTLVVQCAKFLKELSQIEVLRMLELRKTIAEVHMQVHKKIDFLIVLRFY